MAGPKELPVPPVAARDKSGFELLRVWVAEGGQHVSIRPGAWSDPRAWGIMLADLALHIVHAEQQEKRDLDAANFVEQLIDSFQAELEDPTGEPEGGLVQ